MTKELHIHVLRTPTRYLERLTPQDRGRITDALDALSRLPWPQGPDVKRLKNTSTYRLRVGAFRVIFEIDAKEAILRVRSIRSRGDAYKR
jgi:mRNA interferase RelE/StbE